MSDEMLLIEVRKNQFGTYDYYNALTGENVLPLINEVPDWLRPTAFKKDLRLLLSKKASGEVYWKQLKPEDWKPLVKTNGPKLPPQIKGNRRETKYRHN